MNLSIWSSLITWFRIYTGHNFEERIYCRYLLQDLSLGKPNQLIEHHAYLNLIRFPQQPCEVSDVHFLDEEMEFERSTRRSQGLRVGIPSYSTFYPLSTLDTLIEKLWCLDSRLRTKPHEKYRYRSKPGLSSRGFYVQVGPLGGRAVFPQGHPSLVLIIHQNRLFEAHTYFVMIPHFNRLRLCKF